MFPSSFFFWLSTNTSMQHLLTASAVMESSRQKHTRGLKAEQQNMRRLSLFNFLILSVTTRPKPASSHKGTGTLPKKIDTENPLSRQINSLGTQMETVVFNKQKQKKIYKRAQRTAVVGDYCWRQISKHYMSLWVFIGAIMYQWICLKINRRVGRSRCV